MKAETRNKLCKKCLILLREEEAEKQKAYRLKIKQGRQISGKIKIKKHESKNHRT